MEMINLNYIGDLGKLTDLDDEELSDMLSLELNLPQIRAIAINRRVAGLQEVPPLPKRYKLLIGEYFKRHAKKG